MAACSDSCPRDPGADWVLRANSLFVLRPRAVYFLSFGLLVNYRFVFPHTSTFWETAVVQHPRLLTPESRPERRPSKERGPKTSADTEQGGLGGHTGEPTKRNGIDRKELQNVLQTIKRQKKREVYRSFLHGRHEESTSTRQEALMMMGRRPTCLNIRHAKL